MASKAVIPTTQHGCDKSLIYYTWRGGRSLDSIGFYGDHAPRRLSLAEAPRSAYAGATEPPNTILTTLCCSGENTGGQKHAKKRGFPTTQSKIFVQPTFVQRSPSTSACKPGARLGAPILRSRVLSTSAERSKNDASITFFRTTVIRQKMVYRV